MTTTYNKISFQGEVKFCSPYSQVQHRRHRAAHKQWEIRMNIKQMLRQQQQQKSFSKSSFETHLQPRSGSCSFGIHVYNSSPFLPGTESSGIFPSLLPKHLKQQRKQNCLHSGVFCRDLSNPTWRYSGVLQILPNPQRMGFVPVSPWQNLQRDQICFPPPWLCSKCFKGAAQAGFTHNFVGF